jgi:hypothetical protein
LGRENCTQLRLNVSNEFVSIQGDSEGAPSQHFGTLFWQSGAHLQRLPICFLNPAIGLLVDIVLVTYYIPSVGRIDKFNQVYTIFVEKGT